MVSTFWVRSNVRAPVRAAMLAASHPAWPPPITTTSYLVEDAVANILLRVLDNMIIFSFTGSKDAGIWKHT